MSEEQIVRRVQELLQDQHPDGVNIHVLEKGIRLEGEYWYIPVQPTRQPSHTYAYYDALAEVETDLSMNENLKVLLVPTLPD